MAKEVRWAHAANGEAQLLRALADDTITMIEADIMFRPLASQTVGEGDRADEPAKGGEGVSVMAHPPTIPPDAMTFESWLDRVLAHNNGAPGSKDTAGHTKKGIKLDFKSPEAVEPCLSLLLARRAAIHLPEVWLNADILQGPGGPPSRFSGIQFVRTCQQALPDAVLSLGYTTGYPSNEQDLQGYTAAMVDEMLDLCSRTVSEDTHITFPLHLWYAHRSWAQVERLLVPASHRGERLQTKFRTSITLWGEENHSLRAWMEATPHYADSRIYIDLVTPITTSKH